MNLPIGGGFYQSESLPLSAQRCINMFPVIPQTANALSKVVLFHTPGLKQFVDLAGQHRGAHKMAGIPYFVHGNTLSSVDSLGVVTNIGTISGSGYVSMADNGSKLVVVVPNGDSYVYDGSTLEAIADSDFRLADTVSFKDGYFLFTSSDGAVFFNSALNDPLNYRALDFGTAEINPDRIMSSHVTHNELFIIGEETIELYQNIGGSDFPFQRIQGANIQKGSHATFGVIGLDETFAFIGGGKDEKTAIYQVADSSRANKISSAAIDNEIQKFTREEIANARALTYFDRGSQIALFTFESDTIPSRTFAFNATATKLSGIPVWFEFQSGTSDSRWNVSSIVKAYGKILAGTTIGKVGELDHSTYTDFDETIFRQFAGAPFSNQNEPVFVNKLEMTIEAGVGNEGQGLNPVVRMDTSINGKTFSSDRPRPLGMIGQYQSRAIWRRLNRVSQYQTFRFTMTDPVKFSVLKLEAVAHSGGPIG